MKSWTRTGFAVGAIVLMTGCGDSASSEAVVHAESSGSRGGGQGRSRQAAEASSPAPSPIAPSDEEQHASRVVSEPEPAGVLELDETGEIERWLRPRPGRRLYVGNLSFYATEESLAELFGRDGRAVESVGIVVDPRNGRSQGFGFVVMATVEDARRALVALEHETLKGRGLYMRFAGVQPEPESTVQGATLEPAATVAQAHPPSAEPDPSPGDQSAEPVVRGREIRAKAAGMTVKRLLVSNLPLSTDDATLRALFASDGRRVASCSVERDRESGESRGYAFVELESVGEARAALVALDDFEFEGRSLRVNPVEPPQPKVEPGGGGFRRSPEER